MSKPLTIAVANLKPGTGKTTSSVFLAAAFHSMGQSTLLVDADPGGSALAWSDGIRDSDGEPLGFPWTVVGMHSRTIHQQLTTMMGRSRYDVVIIDCPQLEDHPLISKPALRFADHWVIPCAPAGIELDRTTAVKDILDDVDTIRRVPGVRWCLLNRTNRKTRTKNGPDAVVAEIMTEQKYRVFDDQVSHNDGIYRQSYGTLPVLSGTPFPSIARTLKDAA